MYHENESYLYKHEEFQSKCLSEFTCQPIIDPHRGKRGEARKNSGAITFIKEYLPTENKGAMLILSQNLQSMTIHW